MSAPLVKNRAKGTVCPRRVDHWGLAWTLCAARNPAGGGVTPSSAGFVTHVAWTAVVGEAGMAKVEVAAKCGCLVTFLGTAEWAKFYVAEAGRDDRINEVSGTLKSGRITGEFGFVQILRRFILAHCQQSAVRRSLFNTTWRVQLNGNYFKIPNDRYLGLILTLNLNVIVISCTTFKNTKLMIVFIIIMLLWREKKLANFYEILSKTGQTTKYKLMKNVYLKC